MFISRAVPILKLCVREIRIIKTTTLRIKSIKNEDMLMAMKIKMIIISDMSRDRFSKNTVSSRGFQGRGPKGHCREL